MTAEPSRAPALRLDTHPRAAELVALRARALSAVRAHLDARGLLEADVPVLLPFAGSEPHLHPPAARLAGLPGPLWLQTSPELCCKRLLCAGVPAVYALGPAFRGGREELSALHQPEFTMLEWYRPGSATGDLEADVRALGDALCAALSLPAPARGTSLSVRQACERWAGIDLAPLLDGDLARFAERLRGAGLRARAEDGAVALLGRLLVERLEPALRAQAGWVFLHGWPAVVAALARLDPADPRLALRVEAYLGGLEIANGYVELLEPGEMSRRQQADDAQRAGPPPPHDGDLLDALQHAPPGPTVGIALGLDRLLLALTGRARIADVRPLTLRLDEG